LGGGPGKTAVGKPLCEQAEPLVVMRQNLDDMTLASTEAEDRASILDSCSIARYFIRQAST
ncbi:hypothetical protein, partial [Mesorhizobium sp. M4B.F.Ca.ET.013.02.1.1]|uniref:hypothetical protein n=1 Tax=Mesorhizobium sp. M4B.F.Ca.ET.013.02.1.1 TaxID=2496755 RepID=UPI001AED0357